MQRPMVKGFHCSFCGTPSFVFAPKLHLFNSTFYYFLFYSTVSVFCSMSSFDLLDYLDPFNLITKSFGCMVSWCILQSDKIHLPGP